MASSRIPGGIAALLLAALLLVGCERQPASSTPPEEELQTLPAENLLTWESFVEGFIEDYLVMHPAWAVNQGRHEFDGQLPDWSAAGLQDEIQRLNYLRLEAMAFDAAALTPQQLYQREYLLARVDRDLFWLEKARWPFRNPQFYFDWMNDSLDPGAYITLTYASPAERLKAYTRYLSNIPVAAGQIRENLEMPMPRTWLQLGIDAFQGYANYFRDDAPAAWTQVEDPELQAAFAAANTEAIAAMQALADWLRQNLPTATEDFALGEDLFRQMLWDTERVDISIDDLEAVGRADMARNLAALREACAVFAPGADIAECNDRMAAKKPQAGSVEAARQQLGELHAFLLAQDLVSIPGEEQALVAESPPYARSNFAYISIPGPWEKNQPSVYYITPPNPEWPEAVQADYIPGEADLLFTSVHEVWPGHFLNFMHANRAPWLFGRAFVTYAYGEGWAHYTEEMMLDAGLRDGAPEARIGQLSNALMRNARFLSAIGLHARGWSVEQAQRFFMDEAFQSEGTAIQQAARGTYDPAYLNYTMGKLLIRQLREDWTASRGGRAAWRDFHDTFLTYGGPPIPLVRQQLLGEDAPRSVFPGAQVAAPATGQEAFAWDCEDGSRLETRFQGPEEMLLTLPGRSVLTHQVRAASGARYAGEGVLFWSKGQEARLEIGGAVTTCELDAAYTAAAMDRPSDGAAGG